LRQSFGVSRHRHSLWLYQHKNESPFRNMCEPDISQFPVMLSTSRSVCLFLPLVSFQVVK
jgi:hypothetical protein